ncbi:MAG: hypothetical protein A2W91_06040 [Bacteroidetes bacterium GWF2_38_335]|nr:MAG: hypothetical protein A2W91_06040 [Bacteroidetes bacterium GWF2_38_335]OFY81644.1 MAG: hypothetical protein A2281_11835 [Bacteroidetes bacterium RIFOXYA12_FULL_38_20]
MDIQVYSIKDLEDISGIKAHTIRIWEKRYNIFEPQRTDTNIRYYLDNDLRKLLNISILLENNFKISQIAHFSAEEILKKVNLCSSKTADKNDPVEKLIIAMIDFDQPAFEKTVLKTIQKSGFQNTVNNLIYPFFTKVGILWQTEAINPAQEHFVSNIIKKLFFSEIEKLKEPENENRKFILFLHENELHELGLLYSYYLIKKAGGKVIYLGQSVPLPDLVKTWNAKPAEFLVTSFTSNISKQKLTEYIGDLTEKFNKSKIIISGIQIKNLPELNNEKIIKLTTFYELEKILKIL